MNIVPNVRIQFVTDKGERKALAADVCHINVDKKVAEEAIERGYAREATVGEVAEAGGADAPKKRGGSKAATESKPEDKKPDELA